MISENWTTTYALSCNDILRENSIEHLSSEDLKTLSFSSTDNLELCLTIAGSSQSSEEKSKIIWSSLKKVLCFATLTLPCVQFTCDNGTGT